MKPIKLIGGIVALMMLASCGGADVCDAPDLDVLKDFPLA